MSQPSPSAHCPHCGRDIELDQHGALRGHWDMASFTTEECPGAGQYPNGWPAFPPPEQHREMPWWAEHILEQVVGLRADHRAAHRLARATREALAALAQLGAEDPSS